MRRARKMAARGCALALVVTAGTVADARAATVQVEWYPDGDTGATYSVDYVGTPGETNRVWATYYPASGKLTITDTGALAIVPLPAVISDSAAVEPCAVERQRAVCTLPPQARNAAYIWAGFELGDGNDLVQLRTDGISADVRGGEGNDRLANLGGSFSDLAGDAGNDVITGGSGNDQLAGGAGDDSLGAGAGDDSLNGGSGRDTFAGGTGEDSLVYGPHGDSDGDGATTGVRVSLDGIANDGVPGENENAPGDVEEIYGTIFDDVLTGNADGQYLAGNRGNDRLDGGGGADLLGGHDGDDTLLGGDGTDRLWGDDGNDHVHGGGGSDTVYGQYPGPYTWGDLPDDDVVDVRDGEADRFACGMGTDAVLADPLDVFHYEDWYTSKTPPPNDCESVEVQP